MSRAKVAVVAIALNEEANVRDWLKSAEDADHILIADTGCTDATSAIAAHAGARVVPIHVKPWRFDMARNAALALVPDWIEWVIWLDLDERLQPGWRKALEAVPPEVTRVHFWYTWSWNEDGSPGIQFYRDFIHRRYGYHWRHPIHELITRYDTEPEVAMPVRGIEVHHHQDVTKERRGKYLNLLELAVKEDPLAAQMSTWLAREYLYAGRPADAAEEFKRHISMPTAGWPAEIANSMHMLSLAEPENELHWLTEAVKRAPERREHKAYLSKYYYNQQNWEPCLIWADAALAITEKPSDYLVEPFAWGSMVYEFRYVALFHLGRLEEAKAACADALAIAGPEDKDRIVGNLQMMENMQPQ